MKRQQSIFKSTLLIVTFGLVITSPSIFAGQATMKVPDGKKEHIKGVIVGRSGDQVMMRDKKNAVVLVQLEEATKVESPKKIRIWHHKYPVTVLVPGLRIDAHGKGNAQGQLVAEKITFSESDLRIAQDITAGVAGTAGVTEQQIEKRQQELEKQQQAMAGQQQAQADEIQRTQQETAMLNKRISDLDSYDTKYVAGVFFATGSTTLTAADKAALDTLAQITKGTPGYIVEVVGFADPTGSAAMNQELSQKRADAVVTYLLENANIPARRMLTPVGMGTSRDVAGTTGQAAERAVEVKVLVNRGIAGK